MCSVDSSDCVNDLIETREKPVLIGALCRKCSISKASVVLQKKFPYCRECFVVHVRHKFYATLGKSKILKPNDKILIAYSGSNPSSALLHLVKEGIHESRKKKIVSEVVVVFIDEGQLVGLSKEERLGVIKSIVSSVENYGFELVLTNINCVDGDLSLFRKDELNRFFENDDIRTLKTFNGISSISSKEDLLLKLRNRLLVKVARKLHCNKIFTSECSDRCAVNLLSNIALGRGSQLPQDVGLLDERHDNITIVRPMKDWSRKEIVFYNIFHNVDCVTYPRFGTLISSSRSLQKLTEKFVTDLQELYPSTVSTVLRIGGKIESRSNTCREPCIVCQGNLDISNEDLSAAQSSKLSHLVSTLGPKGFSVTPTQITETKKCQKKSSEENCCGGNCGDSNITTSDLSQYLCYGCNLIIREMKSVGDLPTEVLHTAQRTIQLKKMKDEIKDFLI